MNGIQEINIIPEKIQAIPGQEVILSCVGINDLEKQVPVVGVFWDCTGGTISDTGIFKAGNLCGEYSVSARLKTPDGSFKKSAPVTIAKETMHIVREEPAGKAEKPDRPDMTGLGFKSIREKEKAAATVSGQYVLDVADIVEEKKAEPEKPLMGSLSRSMKAKNGATLDNLQNQKIQELPELDPKELDRITQRKQHKKHTLGEKTIACHRVLENNRDLERLGILIFLCVLLGCSIMANCYGFSLEKISTTLKTLISLLESVAILILLIFGVMVAGVRYFYTKPGTLRDRVTKRINDPNKKIDDSGFTVNENSYQQ